MTTLLITNQTRSIPITKTTLADTFFLKFLGLMFRKSLSTDSGLLLADNHESRFSTSIHMLFMNFDICAVWIDKNYRVVDVKIARKWHLAYFPKEAAKYVLELHLSRMSDFVIGDQLQFVYEK